MMNIRYKEEQLLKTVEYVSPNWPDRKAVVRTKRDRSGKKFYEYEATAGEKFLAGGFTYDAVLLMAALEEHDLTEVA